MSFQSVLENTKLRHLRLAEPLVVSPDQPLREVLAQMAQTECACACVAEDGKLKGLFTVRDVLTDVAGRPEVMVRTVGEMMTRELTTLGREASVEDAINAMSRGGYRHIPVVDDDGTLVTCVSAMQIMTFITEHFPRDVRNLPPQAGQKMKSPEGA